MANWMLNGLILPGDLAWVDEFDWSAVTAQPGYSLGGALVVQSAVRQAGRPMTLRGEWVWVPRADVVTLQALSDTPGQEVAVIAPDGRSFDAIFRHWEGALEATPVDYRSPELPSDPYRVTIRMSLI